MDAEIRHLYVHVPFCPTICPYCDFHVLTRKAGLVEAYLSQLEKEAAQLANQYTISLDTVYLGGGTPSFLRDAEITQIVQTIKHNFGWGKLENTLEINPGTVDKKRAQLWRSLGFSRASVGIQSLDNKTLQYLGRSHSAEQAKQAVLCLVETGFRVSGDLITAVKSQPLESDITGLVSLGVGHISAYTLTIEAGTEFARRGVIVSEEDEAKGFNKTSELLQSYGFERYEVSNYAKAGEESRHNLAYWQGKTYLGLGPSAAGHYPTNAPNLLAVRRTNPPLHSWLAGEEGDIIPIDQTEYITDALFMGLRLGRGLDIQDLSRRSGLDVAKKYKPVIEQNIQRGLLEQEGEMLKATPAGWWVLNQLVLEFMEA